MSDEAKSQAEGSQRKPRDNRRIIQGVSLMDGKAMRTYSGDSEEELDALEAALTPQQCERLKASGAIDGDWQPKGKPAAPMPGSRAAREAPGSTQAGRSATPDHKAAEAENKALRDELAQLKARQNAAADEGDRIRSEYEARLKALEEENAALKAGKKSR